MSFSNPSNKTESDNDIISEEVNKKYNDIIEIQNALTAITIDSNSIGNEDKILIYNNKLKKAVEDLKYLNTYFMNLQKKATSDIQQSTDNIITYQKTLKNNNNLFQKYSKDIQNKMQLVATRDRMLQLSQERNIYKKKVIYVLFSIIITLLIAVVSAYTLFGKSQMK